MRALRPLLVAQFLTAFADNAILFTAIAMALARGLAEGWYVPALQSAFLIAFVVLAPWVGRLADLRPKPRVLILGNLVKLAGAVLVLAGVDPLLAYALIGVGAAIYGPAKYGILPELVGHGQLVRANGLMEGSTIVAIVLGTVIGARIADHSTDAALILVTATFLASIGFTLLLPALPARGAAPGPVLSGFIARARLFFATARARFSMLGAALFWAAAAVLRVVLVAWAPLVLGLATTTEIAALTLYLAIGTVIGATLAPRLIPIEGLRKARVAAYGMGALIVILAGLAEPWSARLTLFAAGVAGGLFVVPINAALQDLGHRSIGAGGAVAIQNFFENLGMLAAVGLYTAATGLGGAPVPSILALGVAVIAATVLVSWRLPRDPEPLAGAAGADPVPETGAGGSRADPERRG
jgi:LPLT family lysophospholipid transporter-like MFS transporter